MPDSPLRLLALLLVAVTACSDKEAEPSYRYEPAMALVPAGEFVMGSNRVDEDNLQEEFGFVQPLFVDEHPEHRAHLEAFWIDRYEVSNAQYKAFAEATDYPVPPQWIQSGYNVRDDVLQNMPLERLRFAASEYFRLDWDTNAMEREALLQEIAWIQQQRDPLPVTGVSWYDAYTYCKWAGKRLPREAEWEKAARGPYGAEFPWGNDWDPSRTNTGDGADQNQPLFPVDAYEQDRSADGVYHLAGNVSEWVDDWYRPYDGAQFKSEFYGDIHKVVRGGGAGLGHYALSTFFRGARRGHADPSAMSTDVGFRCAKDVEPVPG